MGVGAGAGVGDGKAVDVGLGIGVSVGVCAAGSGVRLGATVGSGWLHDIATKNSERTMPRNMTLRKLEPPCDYGRDPVAKQGFHPFWATRGREGPNS